MDGWVGGWVDGWVSGCMDGWMGEWMDWTGSSNQTQPRKGNNC